jgi:hypothetical protein
MGAVCMSGSLPCTAAPEPCTNDCCVAMIKHAFHAVAGSSYEPICQPGLKHCPQHVDTATSKRSALRLNNTERSCGCMQACHLAVATRSVRLWPHSRAATDSKHWQATAVIPAEPPLCSSCHPALAQPNSEGCSLHTPHALTTNALAALPLLQLMPATELPRQPPSPLLTHSSPASSPECLATP